MPKIKLSILIIVSILSLFLLPLATSAQVAIHVNQLGYLPDAAKVAIVTSSDAAIFEVLRADDGEVAYQGKLGKQQHWIYSDENAQQADFSGLVDVGEYRLKVGSALSPMFSVSDTALDDVHKAAIKSFYLNRASIDIEKQYAGKFAREAGHPDTKVKVHASAAGKSRPEGSVISAPRGWYDAGDYGKYVVNSGISTYTMLLAYQHFSDLHDSLNLNIPESGNAFPDLLDEIRWNLDWMLAMQDKDGGVYHKLTALNFSDLNTKPKDDKAQRWVIGKSVTASLDFAAVMAVASRVFGTLESDDDEAKKLSALFKIRALSAYRWATQNQDALYQQPKNVGTGAYGDKKANDEFAWAAAELFLLTGVKAYFDEFKAQKADPSLHLTWSEVSVLPYMSLSGDGQNKLSESDYENVTKALLAAADKHLQNHQASAYNVAMIAEDFQWGSNSSALNNGLVLYQAYRLTGKSSYKDAAISTLNYVLGTNATGYSFVTGYGSKTPMYIHHRPSVADKLDVPIPGFIAGGPHTGRQDKCDYPADQPATNYADIECSYSTNEIAINWNAPLVYMLGAAISTP